MLLVSERLLILGRALFHARAAAEALACCQEAESVLVGIDAGGDPERHRTTLAAARSALAAALGDLVREHLVGARADDAVEALRQLLALTRRADSPDVHAVCLSAFSHAREQAADEVGRAWQRATADPFPTFVFRLPRGQPRD